MSKPNYDPNLKQAMSEIEAICEKYNCGAHISLVSETHGEFGFVLPKWTCLFEEVDPNTGNIHIRLRAKKANGDFPYKAEMTVHFLHSLRDTLASGFGFADKFIGVTDDKWKTEHVPFAGFRPKKQEH